MSATLETIIACAATDQPLGDLGEISEALATLVSRHSLGPLAHHLGMPGFERQHLASSLFYESQLGAAEEAVAAISSVGAPVLLIKGIALASRLYSDPAQRPMSDIDLLVSRGAHADAAAALKRRGYWIAGGRVERGRFHHAVSFKRRGSSIDLHRSIVQPLRRGASTDELFRRAVAAPAPLSSALVADPIDDALIILAHIARHELAVRAINYVDAARALDALRPPERDELVRRAERLDLDRPIAAAMAMTAALSQRADLPTSLRAQHRDVLRRREPDRATQLWRKLQLLGGIGDAARLAAGALLERTGL